MSSHGSMHGGTAATLLTGGDVLHDLIERRQWRSACRHLENHPNDAASSKISNIGIELLPIHKACEMQAPTPVIRALLVAHPAGAKSIVSKNGSLALHYACQSPRVSEKTIALLLEYNPAAASTADVLGMLPLHYACKHSAPTEVVDILLATNPEAMHIQDNSYSYPLDYVKNSTDNKIKLEHFKALDNAKKYVDISKSATTRTTELYEARIIKLQNEHKDAVGKLKTQYENEKKRADDLDVQLNKSDVKAERARVERLTKDIDGLKVAFAKECQDYQSQIDAHSVKLDEEIKSKNDLTAKLDEANARNVALLDNEAAQKQDMDNLRTEFEDTMLKLQETSTDRDVAKDCVKSLEDRLNAATDRSKDVEEENGKLKEALRSMYSSMIKVVKEREDIKMALASRNAELKAFAALHEGLTRRALACSEGIEFTAAEEAEDIVDVVLGGVKKKANEEKKVANETKQQPTKEVSVQSETAASDEEGNTIGTKTSSSEEEEEEESEQQQQQQQQQQQEEQVPATVNVPLEEKSLGSLVLEKLPSLSFV